MHLIDRLKQSFQGTIISPEDNLYESVRNTPFSSSGSPSVVLQPSSSQDVSLAIQYARDSSLSLSIRSGGHSVAGFATNNGGIVMDLSLLQSVDILDLDKHIVRIGAGAKWGEVARILQDYHLAISSGDTKSVGVGGLTLSGGIGWMVRKYGLALDNLVGAEIVTADGAILHISETEHPDLFWAIRGGGGNFGVVTSFEFVAHPIGNVFFGTLFFDLDNPETTLKNWRNYMRTADENLTSVLNLMPSFGGSPPGLMVLCCYANDDKKTAMASIDGLKTIGKLLKEDIQQRVYADVLEEAHPPEGVTVIVKNVFAERFTDEIITAIISAHQLSPNLLLQIRWLGGAMNLVPVESTAFYHRKSEVMLLCPTFVAPKATPSDIEKALTPWESIASLGKGAYANFLSTATEEDIKSIYPQTVYDLLSRIKKIYDPQNLFHQNYNILPHK